MKVLIGWSQEVAANKWRRVDLEVDETDLQRILADNEFTIDPTGLTEKEAYMVLSAEAEMLMLTTKANMGYPEPDHSEAMLKLRNRLNKALGVKPVDE